MTLSGWIGIFGLFFVVGGVLMIFDVLHNRICTLEKQIVELQSTVINILREKQDD